MANGRPLRPVDIANYLGVSTQRVHQLTKDPSFPTLSIQTVGERLWRRSAIEAWARRQVVRDTAMAARACVEEALDPDRHLKANPRHRFVATRVAAESFSR